MTAQSIALEAALATAALVTTLAIPGVARAQTVDACIAASEKALVLRKAERLIESRASLATCAAHACPDAVRSSCQQRLLQTNQAIPSIIFAVRDVAGHDLSAVKLSIDGIPYADHVDGAPIARDPGEHEFRFEYAGQPSVVQRFVLHQGEQNRREPITLGTPSLALPAPTVVAAAPVAPESGPVSHTQRTAGLVVGSAGVASLVVGAIFGGLSLAAHNTYTHDCPGALASSVACVTREQSDEGDAATKGTVSTALFVVGGVALAGGATLFFLAPKPTATVTVGAGTIRFLGVF